MASRPGSRCNLASVRDGSFCETVIRNQPGTSRGVQRAIWWRDSIRAGSDRASGCSLIKYVVGEETASAGSAIRDATKTSAAARLLYLAALFITATLSLTTETQSARRFLGVFPSVPRVLGVSVVRNLINL